jgi:hypothetical protein
MKTKNVLCGILMAAAAAIPFRVQAGTLFYVPIPATGSDAQSGLDPAKVYTSAIAAGNVKAEGRTVNGAALVPLAGSGNTCTANGVTLSAATGSLINGGGKSDSIQADGAMAALLSGMIFNDGAADNSEQYAVLDPATLTAGKTYDLRVYVCNASGENRQVSLTFAGDGKPAVSTDFFNEDDATTSAGGFTEPNQVYYINYRFTWDGVSTPGFAAVQKFGSTPFCLYALTNQEVGEADARPAGAVVAVEPEPATPIPRGTRATTVDSTDDIGVSSDVFYAADSLRRHGRWVTVGTYGRCWQPTGVDAGWEPYTRGRWVHSPEDGWVWHSDEDFGWATYHYGRWFREEDSGWYWVPGKVWAPAWVSWRHGHSYIGWAPLPPVALAIAGVGISAWADHRWGIGPRAYNFVRARDFGAPSMAGVLIPRQQNPGIMTNTNNVTNIVNGRRGIYSGGPNFQAVNNALIREGGQPVPTVRIDRRTGTKPLTPDGKFSQLAAGILSVTAPVVTRTKKPGSLPPVAATIAAPKFDKGWNGLPDPQHAAALQAKIDRETPGTTAKTAPAILPGTPPSTPGAGTKTAGPQKPSRPGKTADATVIKPGQPATPTGSIPKRPGQPVSGNITPPQPGQPVTPTAGVGKKPGKTPQPTVTPPQPGQPPSPTAVTPTQPGQPPNPTATTPAPSGQPEKPADTAPTKPGRPGKPATASPPQPGQPASPTGVTPTQPGQPVKPADTVPTKPGRPGKPATVSPPQPVPSGVTPTVPATPTPEPGRPKKRTPQPAPSAVTPTNPATPTSEPAGPKKRTPQSAEPGPAAVTKPATPSVPTPESSVPKKRTPRPEPPAPAPVKPSTTAPATPKPAPETPKPAAATPKPAPAPVAKPIPRPEAPATAPVKPAVPTAPAPPPKKGEKPTPTPTPTPRAKS